MSFAATALRLSAGVLIWAAHFTTIYFFTALACARGEVHLVPWIIGTTTLVGLSAAGLVIVHAFPRREAFDYWLTASIAGFAAIAMLWEAMPVLLVPACR